MANKFYITAGLPVAKNSGQSPTSGVNTFFITAGLPPEVLAAATGTNMQINIGDVWKEVAGAQINIGDVWKTVEGIQINIGDTWKSVF